MRTWTNPQDLNNFKLKHNLDPVEALYYAEAAEKLEMAIRQNCSICRQYLDPSLLQHCSV